MQWAKNAGEVRSTRARAAVVFRVTSIATRRCLAIIPYCHIIVQTFDSSFAWPVFIRHKNVFYRTDYFSRVTMNTYRLKIWGQFLFLKRKRTRDYTLSQVCVSFHFISSAVPIKYAGILGLLNPELIAFCWVYSTCCISVSSTPTHSWLRYDRKSVKIVRNAHLPLYYSSLVLKPLAWI